MPHNLHESIVTCCRGLLCTVVCVREHLGVFLLEQGVLGLLRLCRRRIPESGMLPSRLAMRLGVCGPLGSDLCINPQPDGLAPKSIVLQT